jgi:tetratricopeptide (TPR) repeat protein
VRYNLAILQRREGGDLRSEMRAYQEALRLDPDLVEAHLALGMLLADPATPASMRDASRARAHLTRFLELAPPGDSEGRGQAEDWLLFLDG